MECWGASGGEAIVEGARNSDSSPGKGGYTRGNLNITSTKLSTSFYIYVGQQGGNAYRSGTRAYVGTGGWNGGGAAANDGADDEADGGGGGATDIRISYNSTPKDFTSLKSRIMVAGGGGGAGYGGGSGAPANSGGCGGNTTAGLGTSGGTAYGTAATQVTGNAFGVGKAGVTSTNASQPGGGGGYYGGNVANTGTSYISCAGGGSSYISGYSGCNAIKQAATTGGSSNHTGGPNHYSEFIFTTDESVMISGAASGMPNPNESSLTTNTVTGNYGNGYARITLVNP